MKVRSIHEHISPHYKLHLGDPYNKNSYENMYHVRTTVDMGAEEDLHYFTVLLDFLPKPLLIIIGTTRAHYKQNRSTLA
mgnify:CR=1 FL=1